MTTLTCPSCQAVYDIDPDLLAQNLDGSGKRRLRCGECGTRFSYAAPETTVAANGRIEPELPPLSARPDTGARREPVPGVHKTPARRVGFTQEAPLANREEPRNGEPLQAPTGRERVRTSHSRDGVFVPLLSILLFLMLTGLVAWWVWTNKPEWLDLSTWIKTDNSAQQTKPEAETRQAIIENEIMSLPLARPAINGQKVETKDVGDTIELFLAGVLQNRSGEAVRLERMRAIALDGQGQVAKSWFFSPGARTLANTEVLPFSNRTSWPRGEKLTVKFGWESAIANLPEAISYDSSR